MRPHIRTFVCVLVCIAPALFSTSIFGQVISNIVISRNATNAVRLQSRNFGPATALATTEIRDVAWGPAGDVAYFSTATGVDALDVAGLTVSRLFNVPAQGALALTPDGSRLYVANYPNGVITSIDVGLGTMTAINASPGIADIAVTPDGATVLAADFLNDRLIVIEVATNTQVGTIALDAGTGPYGITIPWNGTTAYVVGRNSNTIVPIDLATVTARPAIPVGTRPLVAAASPSGQEVYVTDETANVQIINTSTNAVTTVNVDSLALSITGVAFSPDGQWAFLTDRGRGWVFRFDTAGRVAVDAEVDTQDYNGNSFVGPPVVVFDSFRSLGVTSEAALRSIGFDDYLIFNGGTLRADSSIRTALRLSLLAGGGEINTNGFTLTLTGDARGTGGLRKSGAGTLVLTGANNLSGSVAVTGGTLQVDGTLPPNITAFSGATLSGSGNVGPVTVNAGASIAPGTATTPGILISSNTTFTNGATFIANINGTVAGSGYDRLESLGRTSLNNSTLNVSLGAVPPVGSTYLIATNAADTFNGLAENATFTTGGATFRINYTGGDGDDVVLTTISAPQTVPPPPPPPTAFPPSISSIPDQTLPMNGATTVSFNVTGAIIPSALQVSVSSSDPGLLPPGSGLVLLHTAEGHWQLTIRGADGRSGTAVVTLTVTDGSQTTSTSFNVTVGGSARPNPPGTPGNLRGTGSGSGVVLTWSPVTFDRASAAAAADRYAIAGGTTPGGTDLPVTLTTAGATSYTIPALPNGTYYFRVYGVNAGGISSPSEELSVTVVGSGAAPGPPSGLKGVLTGSVATLEWTPAPQATNVSQLEIGSAPGGTDLGTMTSLTPPFSRDVTMIAPGTYWLRARTLAGSIISGASNDVAVTIADGACSTAPAAPVLLPMSVRNRQATLAWLPAADVAAERYRVNVRDNGGTLLGTFVTAGAISSFVLDAAPGSYAIDVVAENACGLSTPSNVITPVMR